MNIKNLTQELSRLTKPCLVLNKDQLITNIKWFQTQSHGKKIRIASKSVRSLGILKLIQSVLKEQYAGVLAYHPLEAVKLLESGETDVLIGYPNINQDSLKALAPFVTQKKITFMIDCQERITALLRAIPHTVGTPIQVCIDIDVSLKLPFLHFGVMRSSIQNRTLL